MKRCSIAAAHATDPSKNNGPATAAKTAAPTATAPGGKWAVGS
jgi:3-deoxy-7-phosphoheptulonate synthase